MTAVEQRPISEAFGLIVIVAEKDGVSAINQLPGCWERELSDGWRFALNGHDKATTDTGGGSVPPFSALIRCNGIPVGIIDTYGGAMIGNTEDEFIAALNAAIKEAQ